MLMREVKEMFLFCVCKEKCAADGGQEVVPKNESGR